MAGMRWRRTVPLAILFVALTLVAGACTGGGSTATGPPTGTGRPTGSFTSTPGGPLRLGTVEPGAITSHQCTTGFQCQAFSVTCSGLEQPARGLLEVQRPDGSPRGLVMYFSGQSGQSPWVTPSTDRVTLPFMQSMAQAGFVNVMVAWAEPWLLSAPGEQAGPARLACRAASLVRYVHDRVYAPLGVTPAPERCGFCLAGESGGASEVAYSLSHYGLAGMVDGAVMAGGMPFASIEKGCLKTTSPYYYGPTATGFVDAAYGFLPSQRGPCSSATASFRNRWIADSVNSPDAALSYPRTRLQIIVGGEDTSSGIPLGRDYIAALRTAGTPFLSVRTIPGLSHGVASAPAGLVAVRAALLSG
ncbi:MAG: hypothetical protein M3Q23_08670 [Actinomycetota bacterium]|nr:hypothetical protein [Actinomycetota bacterium]